MADTTNTKSDPSRSRLVAVLFLPARNHAANPLLGWTIRRRAMGIEDDSRPTTRPTACHATSRLKPRIGSTSRDIPS
jgi:hypothetical protein